jgi:hypothetical protein
MEELQFSVAPGTLTALSNLDDDRAHFLFHGDLSQMGLIYEALHSAGFAVVRRGVHPGFAADQEAEYQRALEFIFHARITGWWSQREALLKYGVCTSEAYEAALDIEVGRGR